MTDTAVAIAQPVPVRVPLVAGNSPRAIVPTDFEGAWRIATAVVRAGMAPKSLKTVEACTVAILHGLEVGLTPMTALQSIAVIGGKPSLWGDGALGLIQASGLLDDQDEHYEGQEGTDSYTAVCILKRKGKARPYKADFSFADAKKAGLLDKEGAWQGYMKRMLKMRARSFSMRDGFSDVLKGLAVAEEQQDILRAKKNEPPAPANDESGPPAPEEEGTSGESVQEATPPAPQEDVGPPAPEPEHKYDLPANGDIPEFLRRHPEDVPPPIKSERHWLAELNEKFAAANDIDGLADVQKQHMTPYDGHVSDETLAAAYDILDSHIDRVQAVES